MARTSRRPNVTAGSAEGREIGLDDRELPGGLPHIGNPETHPEKTPEKARRHVPSINQHRVPDPDPDAPYADPRAGEKVVVPKSPPLHEDQYAVPVYQVEQPGKDRLHRKALCDNILVPAAGSDPIPVCGRDFRRIAVRLLNEDANNDIRFSEERSSLLEGRGSLLWHGTNSYTQIETQDELFAIGVSAAALMSVVLVTEVNN